MKFSEEEESILVRIEPHKSRHARCSGCGRRAPVYDVSREERRFRFIDILGLMVYFLYPMRRVKCSHCGVKTELVPWSRGHSHQTLEYMGFISYWAKKLSWQEVAETFHTNWNRVYEAVKVAVEYGLSHREIKGVEAIGVDEVQYKAGHHYVTLIYEISGDVKRLLSVGRDRTEETLRGCLRGLGKEFCVEVKYVCSDMWAPYLHVIKEELSSKTLNILDRFHIVKKCNEAVDAVRKEEMRELRREGKEDILKETKFCFLKRPKNLTERQALKLRDVMRYCLQSVRAYKLKESFQLFWEYNSEYWARWYLRKWCTSAMHSRLTPMKRFVGTIRRHEELLLNWFKAKKRYSSGVVEGLNRKVNLVSRKSYGHKSYEVLEIVLYHTLGNLPEQKFVHRFW